MTLIVEDGSVVTGAESYISVAEADAYHEKRGNATWDAIDDKEALLRKATDYMTGKYRLRWAGSRADSSQSLDWPRVNVPVSDTYSRSYYPSDSVPNEVKQACAILALKANSTELIADKEQKVISVQVGPISTTYEPSSSTAVRYSEVDNLLSPYLKSGSNQVTMVRI
jgi:hypothetical protein